MKLKRGQVFLWSGKGIIATIIQKITGSPWSHCGFILNKEEIIDSDFALSPSKNGVRIRSAEYLLESPENLKIIDLGLSKDKVEHLLTYANSLTGKAIYDLPLIFSFLWKWWSGDKALERMVQIDKAYTCSEFVSHCLKESFGLEVIPGKLPSAIRPHELELLV